jgi:hypothetical protein
MRLLPGVLLLPLLAFPALAQEAPVQAVGAQEASAPHGGRKTWEQHFTQADLAHDGHLTREEAKGGYALVAKHFDEIDVDRKGYVTPNDIKAWRLARKAAHRLAGPAEDRRKPRHAFKPRDQAARPVSSGQRAALPDDPRVIAMPDVQSPG